MQGVSWFTRRAIAMAYLYLTIKHYKGDDGVERIDIDQVLTGGVGASREERTLDWKERETEQQLFGPVLGRSRRIQLEELEDDYLKNGWLPDVAEHGGVQAIAQSDTAKSGRTWYSEQVRTTSSLCVDVLRNWDTDFRIRGDRRKPHAH